MSLGSGCDCEARTKSISIMASCGFDWHRHAAARFHRGPLLNARGRRSEQTIEDRHSRGLFLFGFQAFLGRHGDSKAGTTNAEVSKLRTQWLFKMQTFRVADMGGWWRLVMVLWVDGGWKRRMLGFVVGSVFGWRYRIATPLLCQFCAKAKV